jgi:DNA-directed RNA polymerase subunit RPC12/RpoP
MVKVISTEPHPTVVKQTVCKNCGATLEYVPKDIESRTYTDYGGGRDTDYFIKCPPCGNEVLVKRY